MKVDALIALLGRTLVLLGVACGLAACAAIPSAGPSADQIESATSVGHESNSDADKNYVVIDLNNDVVSVLSRFHPHGLKSFAATKASLPKSRIGVGDILAVQIWEAGEGGLFSSSGSKSVSIPSIVVDRSGKISLPYAGEIPVIDSTPRIVQERIIKELAGRAIQPQAIVNIVKNESNTVILNGDVAKPGRYPLSLKGDRLMDLIADAGGSKEAASETYVTFIRGNQRGSQLLQSVVESDDENVWIQAGDQIYLNHEPRRYSVFGAVAKPGVYPFGSMQVNLLEGTAAAGGLIDERADGTGLFVFRHEPRHVVDAVAPGHNGPAGDVVPVVYRVNMREPAAYFYAKAMMLQDKDVLYVANARAIEVGKVLSLIQLGTRTVGNVLPYARVGN